ncbi:MAG: flagellar protein FliT [Selenomonadaceae bacterium]|nr:flagellar protein FliT [Selenomonadaceae bacterium]
MLNEKELESAKILWEKYLNLTQELLKFINLQDIETFLSLVPQRDQLIELMEKLPSKDYLQLEEFKEIGKKIIPMDREIMYKARAWLNKSRRQNSVVRSYDLTNSILGAQSVAFNRKY